MNPDTDLSVFQKDMDPTTKTDPLKFDSDRDGFSDGREDSNHNGRVDDGESDPNDDTSFPSIGKFIQFNTKSGRAVVIPMN